MNLGDAFGQVLKQHRKRAGLTQEELAFRANMHPTAISFFERGLRQPTLYTVLIIAHVLNVSGASMVEDLETVLDLETLF